MSEISVINIGGTDYNLCDTTARTDLDTESQARANADIVEAASRRNEIIAESMARQNAINAEATARENAINAEITAREDEFDDLKSALNASSGQWFYFTGGASAVKDITLQKDQICQVTNDSSDMTASLTLRDNSNNDLQVIYIPYGETKYFKVISDNAVRCSCYCSTGLAVTLFVINKKSISQITMTTKFDFDFANANLNDLLYRTHSKRTLDINKYEKGHINGNTGENSDYYAAVRARSKGMEVYPYDVVIVPTNLSVECFCVSYYTDNNTFIGQSDWISGEYTIPANQKFRLVLTLNKTESSTPRALETIIDFYRYKCLYPITNTITWEKGTIDLEHGTDLGENSLNGIRSNLFRANAGTIIIPDVFGVPQIFIYDDDGTFLGTATSLGLVKVNEYFVSQAGYMMRANSFEFQDNRNIRISYLYKHGTWQSEFGTLEKFAKSMTILPPDFMTPTYIKNAVLQKQVDIIGKNQFNITFATDIHEYAYHHKAHVYCAELTSRYLLDGGDLLSMPRDNLFETLQILGRHVAELSECRIPVLLTKGNHDYLASNDDHDLKYTNAMWFEEMQKPFLTDRMVLNPLEKTGAYFYIDDAEYKIRIIAMNTFDHDWGGRRIGVPQMKWICETALDLSDKDNQSDWKVLAFGHAHLIGDADVSGDEPTVPDDYSFMSQVYGAINKRSSVTNTYGIDADFTESTFTFIGYLCGHVHADVINNNDGYVHIITTCDHPVDHIDGYPRTFGTKNEYSFDIMNFDFSNEIINCYRVGVGYDRHIHYNMIEDATTLTPASSTGSITWTSNNTSVATVNNGSVTKVSSGYAVIKAVDEHSVEEYFPIHFS